MEYAHLRNDRCSHTYIIITFTTQDSSKLRTFQVLELIMVSKSIIKEAVCFLSEFRMVFAYGRRYNRTYYVPVLFRRRDT